MGDTALQASAMRKLVALAQPPQQTSRELQSAAAALKPAAEALFVDGGTKVKRRQLNLVNEMKPYL